MLTVYTFGYEKRKPEELLCEVERLDAVVIDVRFKPYSRVKGWGRKDLESMLGERYRWVQAFGNEGYKSGSLALMDVEAGCREVAPLLEAGSNLILLCYEANPAECHRSVVAEILRERFGVGVEHLRSGGGVQASLL
ncbi:MAG: DUF488 domain-containing protein [Anaerolineae bacterium]|nr:DUF488 domain-containing protein [Anaerolineae bacterium]